MFELHTILNGAGLLWDGWTLAMLLIGLLFGIITGAIPGFSTPLAISIMLPVTFHMQPIVSMVFLTAIYAGGNFGASISSVLLNIPGSPQAIMTGLDGYPKTLGGRAHEALGLALTASASGNMIGAGFLIVLMPLIVVFALKFGPPEMFMIGVLGMTIIASLDQHFWKVMISGAFGVLISTTGMSSTGAIRGTFGIFELMDGIPLIPTLIGLIGFSELWYMLRRTHIVDQKTAGGISWNAAWAQLMSGYKQTYQHWKTLVKSSVLGVVIGALPGAGATIAAVIGYNEAKRGAKHPEEFGRGAAEGIIGPESANNASEGGALALMLSLGIPGGLSTAVLIGALMLQGLIPGPRLFIDNPELVYGIMLSQFLTSFALLGVGLVVCFWAVRIVHVPTNILVPLIAVFSIVGTYAVNVLMFDVWLMLVFAALGVLLARFSYSLIAVILGVILGPIMDQALLHTYQAYGGFSLRLIIGRPITLLLVFLTLLSLGLAGVRLWRAQRRH